MRVRVFLVLRQFVGQRQFLLTTTHRWRPVLQAFETELAVGIFVYHVHDGSGAVGVGNLGTHGQGRYRDVDWHLEHVRLGTGQTGADQFDPLHALLRLVRSTSQVGVVDQELVVVDRHAVDVVRHRSHDFAISEFAAGVTHLRHFLSHVVQLGRCVDLQRNGVVDVFVVDVVRTDDFARG
ncbi:hypothetical protein D3C86_1575150 [compost metagenome]